MEKNYVVRKLVSGIVVYQIPGESRERKWKGKDARIRIPFEELEKCVYDGDVRKLFERGYLFIEDKECRVALELEEPDPTISNNAKLILTPDKVNLLLYEDDFKDFKSKTESLSDGSLELLLEIAIGGEKQISVDKSDYIRRNFHIDIEKLQRDKRDEKLIKNKEG